MQKGRPESGQKRKRGVRASKTLLTSALHDCGLSTQIALAEKIADLEELGTIPKDLVNRAFREQRIEFSNLLRIANALGVQPHSLILAEKSMRSDSLTDSNDPPGETAGAAVSKKRRLPLTAIGILLTVIVIGTGLLWFTQGPRDPDGPWAGLKPKLDTFSLVLLESTQDASTTDSMPIFLAALQQKLQSRFNVSSPFVSTISSESNPEFIAQEFGADAVLTLRHQTAGAMTAIQYFLHANKTQHLIRFDLVSRQELIELSDKLTLEVFQSIEAMLAGETLNELPSSFAVDEYLQAIQLIDQPYTELAHAKAQSHFRNALSSSPNFYPAHAGLCYSLAETSWNGDSAEILVLAKQHCDIAQKLQPAHAHVLLSLANFQLRSGETTRSRQLLDRVLVTHPGNSFAHQNYANVLLREFMTTGEQRLLSNAKQHADLAIAGDLLNWNAYFSLGNILFYQGQVTDAVKAFEKAAALRPHEILFTNVGTLSFCLDKLELANHSYTQAKSVSEQGYSADEALARIAFYSGSFIEAATLQQSTLNLLADDANIHHMWAALGDYWLFAQQEDKAKHAYTKASTLLEKDRLLGIAEYAGEIYQLYYLLRIEQLSNSQKSYTNLENSLIEKTRASTLGAKEKARYAQVLALLNKQQEALTVWQLAVETCPIYKKNPILIQLTSS